MNLWGFMPDVLAVLEEQFAAFLAASQRAPDAEFFLSTALDHQVMTGRARLRVLTAPDRWLGMSFAADLAAVRAALAALVRAGTYPATCARRLPASRGYRATGHPPSPDNEHPCT